MTKIFIQSVHKITITDKKKKKRKARVCFVTNTTLVFFFDNFNHFNNELLLDPQFE